jgi:hypothetical protein
MWYVSYKETLNGQVHHLASANETDTKLQSKVLQSLID